MVRVKKGGRRIDADLIDAQAVVLPIIRKTRRFGAVTWIDWLLRSGAR